MHPLKDRLTKEWLLLYILFSLLTLAVMLRTPLIGFDAHIEYLLYTLRTPLGVQLALWCSWIGDPYTVVVLGLLLSTILILYHKRAYFYGLVITALGAMSSDYLLKLLIARARPGGFIQATADTTFSYPSGHATAAMALYGFLAFMLWHSTHKNYLRVLYVVLCSLLIAAIGFSRLYLGLHFPSDVVGGYLLGSMWLLFGIRAAQHTHRETRGV